MEQGIQQIQISELGKCRLQGELQFGDRLIFRGEIQGVIRGDEGSELLLGPESLVDGEIHGHWVEIFGSVKGRIVARRLIVRNGAKLVGDIQVGSVQVDQGAELECTWHPITSQ